MQNWRSGNTLNYMLCLAVSGKNNYFHEVWKRHTPSSANTKDPLLPGLCTSMLSQWTQEIPNPLFSPSPSFPVKRLTWTRVGVTQVCVATGDITFISATMAHRTFLGHTRAGILATFRHTYASIMLTYNGLTTLVGRKASAIYLSVYLFICLYVVQ